MAFRKFAMILSHNSGQLRARFNRMIFATAFKAGAVHPGPVHSRTCGTASRAGFSTTTRRSSWGRLSRQGGNHCFQVLNLLGKFVGFGIVGGWWFGWIMDDGHGK